jgi:hypothetical protein
MASTFTDLGLELMATGENAGTWGTKTNANLSLVEQLTGGVNSQAVTDSGTPTALTIADGALTGTAQHRVIELTGSITGNRIVTFPLLTENFYIIKNGTSGAYTVQLKAASGSGATVTFSATDKGYKLIYLDGVATNTGLFEASIGEANEVTLAGTQTLTNKTLTDAVAITNSVTGEIIPGKIEGTNFTNSLLIGHATTGTLNAAEDNTGIGIEALDALTSGDDNVGVGYRAGTGITTGESNTLIGRNAGVGISTNDGNTLIGTSAGGVGTLTGDENVGVGAFALGSAGAANNNVAVGRNSGRNVTGNKNTLIGNSAGNNVTSGDGNVIIGSVDAASATGDRQLLIAGNDGSTTTNWISGDSSGNVTVSGTLTSTTGLVKTVGLETMWVPAAAMYGATTNPADAQQVETTATRPDMKVLDFDASTDEFAQFSVAFPKSWNEGTITYQVYWTPSSTNTGNCLYLLAGVAIGDGDTIDVSYGTPVTITDAGIGTVEDQQVSAVSSAVTIAGSPAVDQQTYFQLQRNASSGSDTFTGDARVLGIKIFFTTDAANDA